ncbi:EamA family transporter [Lactobacillus sp. DCY120]|uniref:EamA family transporter n=1 Tax=Bombilactobacillus apium TaxID=2675299 RepID=A0A850R7L4_9LACO|nr:DMT family transporter [Bombilactobacillus apium]NVY96515.1 EamA family transporter [Bombilactobacillus apium]
MNAKQRQKRGTILALTASAIWGVSGTVMQFVAQNAAVPATWFIGTRTLIAGTILVIIALLQPKKQASPLFKNWSNVLLLVSFSIFGLLANMYTFYYSIQGGNSAAATILQYLSPLFILLGMILFGKQKPTKNNMGAFVIALIGVFLLITQGDIHHLSIPFDSFIWGVLSGLTAALYVVLPQILIKRGCSPVEVTGWGMFISGILSQFVRPIWHLPAHFDLAAAIGVGTIILLGTLMAFLIMITATQYVSSAIVSITDAVQPLVTFVLSACFLGAKFSPVEIFGALVVIVAIYILNRDTADLEA